MSITVSINKQPFTLFESVSLTRSIDNNCGGYKFTSSSDFPRGAFPVEPGDFCEIFVDGKRMAAGYIDTLRINETAGRHTITCFGRDAIQDLVDSSVPDAAKVSSGPHTLRYLCQLVVDALGSEVKILDWLGDEIAEFDATEFMNSESADKCMQYLVSFARKRQVYLISGIDENNIYLIIYRPFLGDKAVGSLIHKANDPKNNILSYSLVVSQADRFNSYVCKSQGNFAIVPLADIEKDLDTVNEIVDPAIRESRYLEIMAEESMFTNDLLTRATEECNLRRVNGQLYKCTVTGHSDSVGSPWNFGRFIDIDDDFAGVHGSHLIKEVEMNQDVARGQTTTLVCCPPDGYNTIPIEDPVFARKTVTGELNRILGYPYTVQPTPVPLKDLL